jgi:CRP-like cAMP-binding protein
VLAIEKVLILKTVGIFSDIPESALVDVASVLEDVELEPETAIFSKGDIGGSLYIVVDGRVRVFDGDRVLAILGEGEIFGEMAALDPQPRMASVTAVERTRLLRMDNESLNELITEQGEVALGIIRLLCRRLRKGGG